MTGTTRPLYIRMHAADDVAIVVNDGGVPAGTVFEDGLTVREAVPQGHKVALADLPAGSAVRRYNVVIGRTTRDVPAGSWVHERLLQMPQARSLDGLPVSTVRPAPQPALEGYTFEGYRNPDGSVGTRNLLAITQTVQCVAGVVDIAVRRIREELLPQYPNVDGVVALEHGYGCGVAIDAPDAVIPIQWPIVRWRKSRMASRPAWSRGSAAMSHSVSKPKERLFRLVEPTRRTASS